MLGADHYFRAWGRPFKFTTEAYLKLADRVVSYSVDNVRIRYSGENDAKAYTAGIDFKTIWGTCSRHRFVDQSVVNGFEGRYYCDSYVRHTYDNEGNILTSETISLRGCRVLRTTIRFFHDFQDYLPSNPKYKLQLKVIWSDGLPFGARATNNSVLLSYAALSPCRYWWFALAGKGSDEWMNKSWLDM